jgi:hypothetical protein
MMNGGGSMSRRIVVVGISVVAVAILIAVLMMGSGRGGKVGGPACKKLREACEAMGFKRGGTPETRRAFFNDCIHPLIKGEKVKDTKFEQAEIQSCRQRFEGRENRRRRQTEG